MDGTRQSFAQSNRALFQWNAPRVSRIVHAAVTQALKSSINCLLAQIHPRSFSAHEDPGIKSFMHSTYR